MKDELFIKTSEGLDIHIPPHFKDTERYINISNGKDLERLNIQFAYEKIIITLEVDSNEDMVLEYGYPMIELNRGPLKYEIFQIENMQLVLDESTPNNILSLEYKNFRNCVLTISDVKLNITYTPQHTINIKQINSESNEQDVDNNNNGSNLTWRI